MNENVLFDFNSETDLTGWYVVDDGVMGGLSQGSFMVEEEGYATFSGNVSLDNNGGFSSIRSSFREIDISDYSKIKIRLKGDQKRYQFRVKSSRYDRHSYIKYFETSGEWETIEINIDEMYPAFRGRRLAMSNFPGESLSEISILVGNKKEEQFNLLIDYISME